MVKNKRIKKLAELTKNYNTLLDIGSDHGYVIKEAFDKGYITKAIATDINKEPLQRAAINLKDYNIKTILSDGFLNVDEDFDVCIIAGMGSYLISDILVNAPQDNKHYILQTNDKEDILRKFLADNNFKIIDEHIVYDKFFYIIIEAEKGDMTLLKEDLILGPILKTKESSKIYYKHKHDLYKNLLPKVSKARKKELLELINIYALYM